MGLRVRVSARLGRLPPLGYVGVRVRVRVGVGVRVGVRLPPLPRLPPPEAVEPCDEQCL